MNFELRGIGFVNKGAELMLHAILSQLRDWDSNHIIAVDLKTGNHSKRSEMELYTIPWAEYKRAPYLGEFISTITQYIPKDLLLRYKFIPYSEIEVILDSSGFAYSDQWGTGFIADLLRLTNKWRSAGKKIIFLPQAFGPFEINQNRQNMIVVINNADLIFARDLISYRYLIQLVNDPSKIKISPDFTNVIDGIVPECIKDFQNIACIIPNARMVDKTTSLSQDQYLEFLHKVAKYLIQNGYDVVILVHEEKDAKFAEKLQRLISSYSHLIVEDNPLMIKGFLGQCSIVIASRYHAIVSSLSQGVPTMGTSWSHKYAALFEDYNCPENLILNIPEIIDVESILNPLLFEPNRSNLIKRINLATQKQKTLTKNMWEDIYHHLIH